jgi:hypothetical protein
MNAFAPVVLRRSWNSRRKPKDLLPRLQICRRSRRRRPANTVFGAAEGFMALADKGYCQLVRTLKPIEASTKIWR